MRRTVAIACLGLAGLLFCSGCGAKDAPKLVPVTGTVTRNGKPVEKAQVVFMCDKAARYASGETDAQGKFRLSTEGTTGTVPGEHVVIVTKAIVSAAMPPPSTPEEMTKMVATGKMVANKVDLLPPKYADAKTSTLKVTVKGDGKDDFTLDLVD